MNGYLLDTSALLTLRGDEALHGFHWQNMILLIDCVPVFVPPVLLGREATIIRLIDF